MFLLFGVWLPFRTRYGVSRVEVEKFIAEHEIVRQFLNKYRRGLSFRTSYDTYAHALCRFFKWLRLEKSWNVSPKDLLNDQLSRLASKDIVDRQFHVSLVLEHSRDNPDFSKMGDSRKYQIFEVIKNFYEYHEVVLTTAKGKFGKRKKRKNYPRQMSKADLKQVLGVLGQRERAICLMMFQSGMEVGAVIYKFSYMWNQIKPQLEAGLERIKIEFDERKGNGNWYFTYISRDAIHELRKWLVLRAKIVERAKQRFGNVQPQIEEGTPIFITNNATPYGERNFQHNYLFAMRRKGLKKKPYEKVSHMIRKLFKTEASIPERAIDRSIVEFWVGHTEGVEKVGAEYDRTPEIYEKVIEKEYMKVEPYINIYSSSVAKRHIDPLIKDFEALMELPLAFVREEFAKLIADTKEKIGKQLKINIK